MIQEIKTSDLVVDFHLDRSTDYVVTFDSGDETQSDAGSTKRTPISSFDASVWSVSANYAIDKILPVFTTVNGNSSIWNANNTIVVANSANWNSNFTLVNGTSANWNSVYSYVNSFSANWYSTFTTVKANSANWNAVVNSVSALSANWNSTFNSVNETSSNWNSVYSHVNAVSAKNVSVYSTVNTNSSINNSANTTVNVNSAIWNNVNLLTGGTVGQILEKNTDNDMQFIWRNKRTVVVYPTISTAFTMSTSTFNALLADQFVIQISGAGVSATFMPPINGYDNQMIMWDVRHITANTTVVLNSAFRLPTASLSWSSLSGKLDIFAAKYNLLDNRWDVISFLPGYNF